MPNLDRLLAAFDCDHTPSKDKCVGCPYYGAWHNVRACKTGGIKADIRSVIKALRAAGTEDI